MKTAHKRPVVHIELFARNRTETARFYQRLFGWDFADMPEKRYTMVDYGNPDVSMGIVQADPGDQSQLRFYVQSDNVTADLDRIQRMGGEIAQPLYSVPGVGDFAWFRDPGGNLVAIGTFATL